MIRIAFHLVVNAVIILVLSTILKGFDVSSFSAAFVFVAVLSVVNSFVLPLIKLFTFPINWFSLGLFNLLLNLGAIMFVINILKGVNISSNYFLNLIIILVSLTVGNSLGKMIS